MKINFTARFMSAFGRVAANVSHSLDDKGFAEVVQSELRGLKVYSIESSSYFDELKLFDGKKEYLFAYRSLAEEYAGVFATPPMITLNRAKKIITTPIDNSNDIEVVERYTTQPWDIDLRGLVIDMENHIFPLSKMRQLNEIFEVNSSWNVASMILQSVGVNALYIKSINIEFIEGYEDTIAYTMSTRAIKPLSYQLING